MRETGGQGGRRKGGRQGRERNTETEIQRDRAKKKKYKIKCLKLTLLVANLAAISENIMR